MRNLIAAVAVVLLTCMARWTTAAESQASPPRPNIVIILVDDMGFSDIGCYGSEIPTPNLDKLAAGGLKFTQFYNTGRCCPTRASLLTGLYPHQAGVGHMTDDDNLPGYRGRLNDRCVTIGQVLQSAGYFTSMAGKWHVGQEHGVVPWKRGFDASLNAPAGGFYYPDDAKTSLFLNGRRLDPHGPELPHEWYTTDLFTDYAIKFVDQGIAAKKPFFLYLPYNAPHFPLEAPGDEIAKFRGHYKMGWDKLREERRAKEIELGVVDKAWALSPRPPAVKDWESLTPEEQDRFDHIMAIYAAVIQHMDAAVGRLVAGLTDRGILDDTLILFLSDNGGNAESGPNGRLEGDPPGGPRSTVFEGQSWATLSNTPFRRYKHFNHEGGIATPLIVHWPDRIKAPGQLRTQPGHVIDLMATCVDVAGATYPKEFDSKPIQPMEGRSLIPAIVDDKPIERDAIYWEHEGNAAIRVGDWKLVRFGRKGKWELYNMAADRTELHDLSTEEPQRAKELLAKWDAWAKRAHVEPDPSSAKGNGNGKKKATAEE
ncbi:MAG TPA: arylsulfatase [Tepidisphaeraceae bacterium]|jgi:arylsulfatase